MEERLRFHCSTNISEGQVGGVMNEFLSYVDGILCSKDKGELFRSFLRLPLPTVELTDAIFNELKKVFYGQNAVFEYKFTDANLLDDWNWYSGDVLKEAERWRGEGFERFKYDINSVLVVDMPREQDGALPCPYYYWLDISDVIAFRCYPDTDRFEWIAFRGEGDTVNVFDDTYYRTYRYSESEDADGERRLVRVSKSEHGLGYCPVCFFWTEALNTSQRCIKRSPLTKELDNLDYLLFKVISKRIADLGGEYPIYWHYQEEQGCDYEAGGVHCDGGFLRDMDGHYLGTVDGGVQRCPVCGSRKFRGAGSDIPIPIPEQGQPDLTNPIGIVATPVNTLKNISEDIKNLKNTIFQSVVGFMGVDTGTAMNEYQVRSTYESRRNVLNSIKANFERAQAFVEDTVCRLRYGEKYVNCVIDYGTEFYIYSSDEIRNKYKSAKDSGASATELDYLGDQIIFTETKNNPVQQQRLLMLKQIEPYRHMTISELQSCKELLDPELVAVKLNFSQLIDRFERENTLITEFALNKPFYQRIDEIINTLKTYINGK